MLTDYLEEHPDDAKTIVQKVILAATSKNCSSKSSRDGAKKNCHEFRRITR
jgi:DNA gyrase subunit B